jgi:hypothetical protein
LALLVVDALATVTLLKDNVRIPSAARTRIGVVPPKPSLIESPPDAADQTRRRFRRVTPAPVSEPDARS